MADRELNLIKKFENGPLYRIETGKKSSNTEFHLAAHFDGDENMAIGYGLDLYVNTWDTIKKHLENANKIASSQFDFKKTCQVSEKVSYTFQTIVEKYQSEVKALSVEKKGVLWAVLKKMKDVSNYKDFSKLSSEFKYNKKAYSKTRNSEVYQKVKTFCTNYITPLVSFPLPSVEYAAKLIEAMTQSYRNDVKNRLKPGEYDQLFDCQKGALLSLAYNALSLIGNNSRSSISKYLNTADDTEKIKYRALVWAEIRYWSNKDQMQGLANRRYQEADYWGLTGENDTDDDIYYKHQLEAIRNLDLEQKLALKATIEETETPYKKSDGNYYTLKNEAKSTKNSIPSPILEPNIHSPSPNY